MRANVEILRDIIMAPNVLTHSSEPIKLSSGEMSKDFIDGKLAVASKDDLALVGSLMYQHVYSSGVKYDAVGGLVLGAIPYAFAISYIAGCGWFMVRKEPKGRGTNRWIEGTRVAGMQVVLVDDVVTTGGSIRKAYDRITEEGGKVVFATTLVDRGCLTAPFFNGLGIPYVPMLTYMDIGIDPVGTTGSKDE